MHVSVGVRKQPSEVGFFFSFCHVDPLDAAQVARPMQEVPLLTKPSHWPLKDLFGGAGIGLGESRIKLDGQFISR